MKIVFKMLNFLKFYYYLYCIQVLYPQSQLIIIIITQQKFKITCPKHPKNPLDVYINIDPNFSQPRFHCAKCFFETMKAGSNLKDFLPFQEFIEDFGSFLKQDGYKNSHYSRHIQIYSTLFANDIDELINKARDDICQQLEQLRASLKEQIILHKQFKQKLNESHLSWSKVVGYIKFQEEYAQIQQLDKDSHSQEWKNLEISLESIIKQAQTEQNDEFQVISSSLDQIYQQLSNLQAKVVPYGTSLQRIETELQSSILKCLSIGPIQTYLCSQDFINEILKKLNKKVTSSQLLYKLGQDAKDHSVVWQRINGKSNTLMFIKLQTNEIIGAYTPAVWNSNVNNYIADNSCLSFLFSVTKQQIYPLSQNNGYALYNLTSSLPTFGGGHDLQLTKEFQLGYSNIGHTYQISQYKPVDATTHLANAKSSARYHYNYILRILPSCIVYIDIPYFMYQFQIFSRYLSFLCLHLQLQVFFHFYAERFGLVNVRYLQRLTALQQASTQIKSNSLTPLGSFIQNTQIYRNIQQESDIKRKYIVQGIQFIVSRDPQFARIKAGYYGEESIRILLSETSRTMEKLLPSGIIAQLLKYIIQELESYELIKEGQQLTTLKIISEQLILHCQTEIQSKQSGYGIQLSFYQSIMIFELYLQYLLNIYKQDSFMGLKRARLNIHINSQS